MSTVATTEKAHHEVVADDKAHKNTLKSLNAVIDIDFIETPTEYRVHADLPGVERSEIDINIENGLLTITAERRNDHHINEVHHGVTIHHTERQYGKVKRTLRLPSNADANSATAKFTNGVLDLTLPKIEGSSIKVEVTH